MSRPALRPLRSTAAAVLWLSLSLTPAQAADEIVYVAKDGDNLISIARDWMATGSQWDAHRQLARHNRLSDADRIRAGRQVRIPVAWLRREAVAGKVKRVQGSATSAGAALLAGAVLQQGAGVQTGADGYVTLALADGSELAISPDTDLRIDTHQRHARTGVIESALRLVRGAVDALVAPVRGTGARFEINSDQAVAAVRGTEFRLRASPGAGATHNEVLKGEVAVSGVRETSGVLVQAGFGTMVDATRKPLPPVRLLPAPDLSGMQKEHERVMVRLAFPALPGAVRYRALLARDSAFTDIVREDLLGGNEARYSDLPDSGYFFRLRGIDGSGLEGLEASAGFRLKARPEPPFPSAPANRGKLRGTGVELSWSSAAEAAGYRLIVQRSGLYGNVVDTAVGKVQAHRLDKLPPGEYHWSLASVRANGEMGPWSVPQHFTLLPPPPVPEPPAIGDGKVRFSWSGEPGQVFTLQLARDAGFGQVIRTRELKDPGVEFEDLEPGAYFMRYRATDPDGFVGPYTSAQGFEVPRPPEPPPRPWWLLLILLAIL